jgi:hypothetical protein
VVTSTNLAQQSDCDARVGDYVGMERQGRKVVVTYRLRKTPRCRIEDSTIRFVFDPAASGCSEWSPRVTASFLSYRYEDHHRPAVHTVYWGLVGGPRCSGRR